MSDYRTRIYKKYASLMQDAPLAFDENDAKGWGRLYDTYLRGWLPEKKEVAILDVACGGGKLLYFFKSRGYTNLSGVDISPEQIALSRQVIEHVVEADAIEFLESHENKYDLITGLDIVEHFKKDEVLQFLYACHNALKHGGRLILQTPNAESPLGMKIRYGDFTHEVAFNTNSLKGLLLCVDFSEIESREAGPVMHGVLSLGRSLIWRVIRAGLIIWNLAEAGSKGSGIYTRVFLITGRRGGR